MAQEADDVQDQNDDEHDDQNDDGAGDGDSKTFDESYVKKLRDEAARHRREKQDLADRLKAIDDKDKTEAQKLEERAAAAEQRAASAESSSLRLEVALDKAPEGMSSAQIRKLAKRLTGSTQEELEADAEELFADFAPKDDDSGQESLRGPRERLRSGTAHSDSDDEELSPDELADLVPRRYKL